MEKGDYRKVLKEILLERQQRNSGYSLRALSRDLGVSVTALHGALNLERHLSAKNLESIANKLGWSAQDLDFLKQNRHLEADPTQVQLEEDQFRMIADWIHMALLSLSKIPNIEIDQIPKLLKLEENVCHAAIERLCRLNFIKIENNKMVRVLGSFGTSQNIPSRAIRAFHYKNLQKAQEVIESIPIDERDFFTIAVPSCPQKYAEAKKLMQEFRKQMLTLLESEEPERVYFLNVQLYPVTEKPKPPSSKKAEAK